MSILREYSSLKTMSLASVVFLTIITPLVQLGYGLIEAVATIRIYSALFYFAISVAVAMWFFWLGLKIGERQKEAKVGTMGLIAVAVVSFLVHIGFKLFDQFWLYVSLSDWVGSYIAEMLTYRAPMLLHGVVFMVLGILTVGKENNSFVKNAWTYCGISAVLYLVCCVAAQLVYCSYDEIYVKFALIHAVSVFPLVGLVMSVYSLAGKGCKVGKYKGLEDFLEYLCPSAIFIYVLKLYSPILVIFYLVVMWFIYRKFRR